MTMKHYFPLFLLFAISTTSTHAINSTNSILTNSKLYQELINKYSPQITQQENETTPIALDSITFDNGCKKLMNYNANGQLLSFYGYEKDNDETYINDIETCTYNTNGQILSKEVSKYDSWEDRIVTQWKYEYTYDNYSRITSEIQYLLGDDAPYDLVFYNKEEYAYNDEDGTFEVINYNWDNSWTFQMKEKLYAKWGVEWESSENGSYTILTLERIDSIYVYDSQNTENTEWLLMGKQLMQYQNYDQITTIHTVIYEEDLTISGQIKEETTYNPNGDILSETTKQYYQEESEWLIIIQETHEYNDSNQITMSESNNLSWTTGELAPTIRLTYEYNTQGQLDNRKVYFYDFENEDPLTISDIYELSYITLNTENIMLPDESVGYYYNGEDFYDVDFYRHGAIDEVKHYHWSYQSESLELTETVTYHYTEYTDITNAVSTIENLQIKLYPNPVIDQLNIECPAIKNGKLCVYNLMGELVKSAQILESATTVSLEDISKGMYILTLSNNDGLSFTQKINKK
jgi:hypothetical protein